MTKKINTRLSIAVISVDDALKAAMQVPPSSKKAKPKPKRKEKDGK